MKYPPYQFAWVQFCLDQRLPRGYSPSCRNWVDDYAQACNDADQGNAATKEILEQYLLYFVTNRLKE